LLYSISQRHTMIWPDQTILFIEDSNLLDYDAMSWAKGAQCFKGCSAFFFKGILLRLHTLEDKVTIPSKHCKPPAQ
jgi:hypothetical protein